MVARSEESQILSEWNLQKEQKQAAEFIIRKGCPCDIAHRIW